MSSSSTSPFPLYLLPSLPFRRRRSSATTTSSSSTPSTPSTSPPTPSYLTSTPPTSHLRCYKCLTDLIPTSSIISKGFTGRHGRAYLVAPPNNMVGQLAAGDLPNVSIGKAVPRQLVTGAHTVADISCTTCDCVLGWKYVKAEEEGQKYKVGKYILETRRVVKSSQWDREYSDGGVGGNGGMGRVGNDGEIEFDSQDEDECEDLFSGIWTPELARRRRRGRIGGR